MYAYIKGTLTAATPIKATIEAGGIGYAIHIAASAYGKLPPIGSDALLFTSFIVRENAHILYGFASQDERDLFELLITVSGIGPKIGLSLIGHMTPDLLCRAVECSDLKMISKIPGIGKKTAERLIIEMRDKLPGRVRSATAEQFAISGGSDKHDAISALINLGYQAAAAEKAVEKTLNLADGELSLSALITKALKNV